MNKKHNSFFQNSSIYFFSTIVSFAIGILVLPVYTRYLSPGDFGIVILFVMFGTLLTQFLSISIHFSSYRYFFKYRDNLKKFNVLNSSNMFFLLFIFGFSGFFVFLLAEWISIPFFNEQLSKRLIQLSFVSGCLEYIFLYLTYLLTAREKAVSYAVVTILRALMTAVISFYFIFEYSLTYMARINSILISNYNLILLTIYHKH